MDIIPKRIVRGASNYAHPHLFCYSINLLVTS